MSHVTRSTCSAVLGIFLVVIFALPVTHGQTEPAPPHSVGLFGSSVSLPDPTFINAFRLTRLISCDCTVDGYDFCTGIPSEALFWDGVPYARCTTRDNQEPYSCSSSVYTLNEYRARYGSDTCDQVEQSLAAESLAYGNFTYACDASPTICTVTYSTGWFGNDHNAIRDGDHWGRAPAPSTRDARCSFSHWPADGSCGPIDVPSDSPYANLTFADHKYCCGRSGGVPTAGAFGFPCGCAPDVPCYDCGVYPSPDDIPWHDRLWTDPQLTRDGYDLHPLTSDNAAFDKCLYQPFVATDEQTGSRAKAQSALYDNCRLDPSTGARWCCAVGDGRLPTFNPEDATESELTGYCECAGSADNYVYPCDYCGASNTAFGSDYPDAVFTAHPNARRTGPLPPPPPFGVRGEGTPSPAVPSTGGTARTTGVPAAPVLVALAAWLALSRGWSW